MLYARCHPLGHSSGFGGTEVAVDCHTALRPFDRSNVSLASMQERFRAEGARKRSHRRVCLCYGEVEMEMDKKNRLSDSSGKAADEFRITLDNSGEMGGEHDNKKSRSRLPASSVLKSR